MLSASAFTIGKTCGRAIIVDSLTVASPWPS